jgi:2-dehydropantoate 2-reductase
MARGETLRALRDGPLTLEDDGRRDEVRLSMVAHPSEAGELDLVLICAKSYDTPAIAARLAEVTRPGLTVLSLQNGVHNVGELRRALPHADVGGVAVYLGCERLGANHVVRRPSRNPKTGVLRDRLVGGPIGPPGERLARVGATLGVHTEVHPNPDVPLWTKLIANVAMNTVTALGRARVGQVTSDPAAVDLMIALGDEVVAVAQALGLDIPDSAARDYVDDARQRLPKTGGSSTLFDLEAGRRLEREALVGAVVHEAACVGITVPYSTTCDALLRLVDPTRPAAQIPAEN